MGKENNKYRIPLLNEFVQGFKYELKKTYSFGFIENGRYEKSKEWNKWIEGEVWWMHPDDAIITSQMPNGGTLTMIGRFVNFGKPFNIESYLKQGLLRVKIGDYE